MDTKQFGLFIQAQRKSLGLTQSELAAKIHVTDKAISRWERGVGFPDINLLEPLASALNVTLIELLHSEKMDLQDNPQALQTQTNQLLEEQKRLSIQRRVLYYLGYTIIAAMCTALIYVIHHADLAVGLRFTLRFIFLMIGLVGTMCLRFIVYQSWLNRKPWGIWHNYYAWIATILGFLGVCLVKISSEIPEPWSLLAVLGGAAIALSGWVYFEFQKENHDE